VAVPVTAVRSCNLCSSTKDSSASLVVSSGGIPVLAGSLKNGARFGVSILVFLNNSTNFIF